MKSKSIWAVTLLLCSAGCGNILDFLRPNTTTVRLVNNSSFPVAVTLFYDDDQEIPEALLTETGTEVQFEVLAGRSIEFSRNCDRLQAIMVDDADLLIIGEIGPETSTGVFRDGSDFSCNDTIILTFDHSDLILDFNVSFGRQRG